MQTPTCRITRSITVLSDSNSKPNGSPSIRDTGNGIHAVKNTTSQSSKNGKRQMDNGAVDSSSKKRNSYNMKFHSHNCGMYVIKFAKYIIHQKIYVMADTYGPKTVRFHLAAQLYKHVCKKVMKLTSICYHGASSGIERSRVLLLCSSDEAKLHVIWKPANSRVDV
ncbi:uncharacterized protein LOC111382454 [Olea europaea var. sylvestris]|uniref:uncharacterized protein LOC111382454 n=1 Tax=Olea europaea var. sylvestris TaxID=158386 RepID=UPI000C1D37F0|nr:uncharacterized protein LOC111382454 [Olea europaea var. sylvestris]